MNYQSFVSKSENVALILFVLFIFNLTACTYFKTTSISNDNISEMYEIGKAGKKLYPNSERDFFLHTSNNDYSISNVSLDSLYFTCNIDSVKPSFYYSEMRSYRYKVDEKSILKEAHIYLNKIVPNLQTGYIEIPLNDIREIKVINYDYLKEALSVITIVVVSTVAAAATLAVIVLLTKSSCPYVYVNNGDIYIFEGEIYGGSIAKNLIRDDYIPLPSIKQIKGNYYININNELKEKQYTDIAELIVVDHPKEQEILIDKYGELQTFRNEVLPIEALSLSNKDLLQSIIKKDKEFYSFNELNYTRSGVKLKFQKPNNSKEGKLRIKAKNSFWFDYLFGEFISKFGTSYDKWMSKQAEIPQLERIQRMIDSEIPLFIYKKTNEKWELVDYIYTIGPLASREMVIPIDFSDIESDIVEIKIETGFMFWELDYVAMDFSENKKNEIRTIKPSYATGSGSIDWTSALLESDGLFMKQDSVGQITEIMFESDFPKDDDMIQSVFLHTRGYYELIRDFKGLPKVKELKKFKEAGYFAKFSRDKFLETIEKNELSELNLN